MKDHALLRLSQWFSSLAKAADAPGYPLKSRMYDWMSGVTYRAYLALCAAAYVAYAMTVNGAIP